MELKYPDVTPNEKAGRALGAALRDMTGGEILAVDTDKLRGIAGQLQARANATRQAAEEVVRIGTDAQARYADGGFREEYEPSGAYSGGVYGAMTDSGEQVKEKLEEAARRAEHAAGALQWVADHHDEIISGSVANVDAIDTDLASGSSSGGASRDVMPTSDGSDGGSMMPRMTA